MVNNLGHSGGLARLWKKQESAKVGGYSRNDIDLEVDMAGMCLWCLTGFYSPPESH